MPQIFTKKFDNLPAELQDAIKLDAHDQFLEVNELTPGPTAEKYIKEHQDQYAKDIAAHCNETALNTNPAVFEAILQRRGGDVEELSKGFVETVASSGKSTGTDRFIGKFNDTGRNK